MTMTMTVMIMVASVNVDRHISIWITITHMRFTVVVVQTAKLTQKVLWIVLMEKSCILIKLVLNNVLFHYIQSWQYQHLVMKEVIAQIQKVFQKFAEMLLSNNQMMILSQFVMIVHFIEFLAQVPRIPKIPLNNAMPIIHFN